MRTYLTPGPARAVVRLRLVVVIWVSMAPAAASSLNVGLNVVYVGAVTGHRPYTPAACYELSHSDCDAENNTDECAVKMVVVHVSCQYQEAYQKAFQSLL